MEDENLGDDFEATPWLPPSLDKAMAFKNSEVYANGDGRLDAINIIQAPDLGTYTTVSLVIVFNASLVRYWSHALFLVCHEHGHCVVCYECIVAPFADYDL